MKVIVFFILILFFCNCNLIEKNKPNLQESKTLKGFVINNKKADSLNGKGIELSKNEEYKESRLVLLKALELEPNHPTILSNLGLNSYLAFDYLNAIDYYQKSYKASDSTYHIAAVNLGLTYYYSNEYENGIKITEHVIGNATDNTVLASAYVHKALNRLGLNDCKSAKKDLELIIKNYSNVEGIDYHIRDLTGKIKNCVQQNPR